MRTTRAWESPAGEPAAAVGEGAVADLKRREAADVAGVARCPLCAAELVARMGRAGPVFACRCRAAVRAVGARR